MRFMENGMQPTPPSDPSPAPVSAGRHWPSIVTLILAVIYTVSPADAIPDLPVIGWIDDATVMMFASSWFAERNMGIQSEWLQRFFSYGKIVLFLAMLAIFSVAGLVAFGLFKLWTN